MSTTGTVDILVSSVSEHSSMLRSKKHVTTSTAVRSNDVSEAGHSAHSVAFASKSKAVSAVDPSPKKRPHGVQPSCCSVPIGVVFAAAGFLIAAALGANCALSGINFQQHVKSNVHNEVSAGLEGMVLALKGSLTESVSKAVEFQMMIESNPNKYACDDAIPNSFPGNTSNANFLELAAMYALPKTNLLFIYQVRSSKRFVNADGTPVPLMCVVEASSKRLYYFVNRTVLGTSFVNAGTVQSLRSLPTTINVTFDARNTQLVTNPMSGIGPRWVPGVLPISLAASGTSTTLTHFQSITDPAHPGANWSIGIQNSLKNVRSMLLRGTPPINLANLSARGNAFSGAHTTLYHFDSKLLLASTSDLIPFVRPVTRDMWPAGNTNDPSVNEGYKRATIACPHVDSCKDTSIVFDGDMIWATLSVVDPDSNLGLLVVTGVPRKHFFAEADATLLATILVAAGCCVLLVVGCALLLVVIYRPLASLGMNMLHAAELHNDRVEHTRTYLREISTLSSIFDQMNQQLLVARSFVPEAVLLGKTEDASREEGVDDEGSILGEGTRASVATSRSLKSRSGVFDEIATEGSGATESSGDNIAKLFNVCEKRVGVLSLNLVGLHDMCAPGRQSNRTRRVQEITASLLTLALAGSPRMVNVE